MGDIAVSHKQAAESDTKCSCLLFRPCSLHPWPLRPQELVTMEQQPLLVRPNKLPARRASSAGPSMSPCGTLSIKRRRSRSVWPSTRRNALRESSDCASRPPDRNAIPSTSSSATPSTRMSVSRSSGPNTSHTQSLNAQLSTSRIVNLSGEVMAMTRCGRPSREPARMFPTTSARMCRRPTPSRLLTRSATTCQSRSVSQFPIRVSRQEPKKICDEGSVHAPLAAPVHQAAPSVQDLLNYGVPAVPAQAVPEVILARDKQKLQNAANNDRIVFG